MIKSKSIHTNNFLKYLDILERKGIKRTTIAEDSKIKYSRITDIKNNRSSADKEMVDRLLEVYSELTESEKSQEQDKTTLDWREDRRYDHFNDEDYKRFKELDKKYFEMLEYYKKRLEEKDEHLKEKDKQLEEKDKQLYNLINKILEKG